MSSRIGTRTPSGRPDSNEVTCEAAGERTPINLDIKGPFIAPRVFTAAQAEAGRLAYDNSCGKWMTDDTVVNITAYALQMSGAQPGTEPLTRTTGVVVNSLVP